MNQLILNNLPNILGAIALTLFVFILIREVICWYFKINERITLQQISINKQDEIIQLLKNNNEYLDSTQKDRNFKY